MRRVNRWHGAALDPRVDDLRHARRRWLAVVRAGPGAAAVRRRATVPGRGRGRTGGRHRASRSSSSSRRATRRKRPCAEPHCWATLLPPDQFSFPSGHTITAFAVSLSLSRVLSRPGHRAAVLRRQRGGFAHSAGHALFERRAGRGRDRCAAGNWGFAPGPAAVAAWRGLFCIVDRTDDRFLSSVGMGRLPRNSMKNSASPWDSAGFRW